MAQQSHLIFTWNLQEPLPLSSIKMVYICYIIVVHFNWLFICVDLPKSAENNSIITVLAVVLVSTLALFTLITAVTIVTCFVFKKKRKRKILNLQEHVYESVSLPPTTLVTFSEPASGCDLHDEAKTTSGSTATKFEMIDNEAYSSSKPPAVAENDPNTESTESVAL